MLSVLEECLTILEAECAEAQSECEESGRVLKRAQDRSNDAIGRRNALQGLLSAHREWVNYVREKETSAAVQGS